MGGRQLDVECNQVKFVREMMRNEEEGTRALAYWKPFTT
jgi:hypothetical protein